MNGQAPVGHVRLEAVLRALHLLSAPSRRAPLRTLAWDQIDGRHLSAGMTFRDGPAAVELWCDQPDVLRRASVALEVAGVGVGSVEESAIASSWAASRPKLGSSRLESVPGLADLRTRPRWQVSLGRVDRLDVMPLAMVGATSVEFAPGVDALWSSDEYCGDVWWVPRDQVVVRHEIGSQAVGVRYCDSTSGVRWAGLLVEMVLRLQHVQVEFLHARRSTTDPPPRAR